LYVPTSEVNFVPFETLIAIRTGDVEWDLWHYDRATLVTGTKNGYVWTEEHGICIGSTVELDIYGDPEPENFVKIPFRAPRSNKKKAVLKGMGSVGVSQHISEDGWTLFTLPVASVEFSKHGPTKLLSISGPEMIQADSLIADPRIHFVHEWIPQT